MTTFKQTLEQFLTSKDFQEGVIASTKAGWGGSGYSVELFPEGHWRVQWNNMFGNRYDSPGIILALPGIHDDGTYEEAVVNGGMEEDDYFGMAFANDEEELAKAMREVLADAIQGEL